MFLSTFRLIVGGKVVICGRHELATTRATVKLFVLSAVGL